MSKSLKIVWFLASLVILASIATRGSAVDPTFTGPTQGPINEASTDFTISVDKPFNGNFHVDVSGGGLNEKLTFDFSKDTTSASFTITPSEVGTVTLLANADGGPKIEKALYYNVVSPTPTPTATMEVAIRALKAAKAYSIREDHIPLGTNQLQGLLAIPKFFQSKNFFSQKKFVIGGSHAASH